MAESGGNAQSGFGSIASWRCVERISSSELPEIECRIAQSAGDITCPHHCDLWASTGESLEILPFAISGFELSRTFHNLILPMPSIPFYALKKDFVWLFDWINEVEELAFIVPDGPGRWKAVTNYSFQGEGHYTFWHVNSGPLPMIRKDKKGDATITDPWGGWKEEVEYGGGLAAVIPGLTSGGRPFFGPTSLGTFDLSAIIRASKKRRQFNKAPVSAIARSHFSWVGNHYSILGHKAQKSTERLWAKLKRSISKPSVKIPRQGPLDGTNKEIWALPTAYEKIRAGRMRIAY